MRTLDLILTLACVTAVAACSGATNEADTGSDAAPDSFLAPDTGAMDVAVQPDVPADSATDVPMDTTRPDAGVQCELGAGPYGNSVGDRLPAFQVQSCDGETVAYPDDFQCPRVLVLVNAAGWCLPCIRETVEFMEKLVEPYQERGLEIVQLLYQTDARTRPDAAYCDAWVESFELSRMRVVLDPENNTLPLFQPLALPTSIVVDAAGIIRFYGTATPDELVDIVDALISEYE